MSTTTQPTAAPAPSEAAPVTMYRASTRRGPAIEALEVVRETEKTVVIKCAVSVRKPDGLERIKKEGGYWGVVFPTWEAAHEYLQRNADNSVRIRTKNLEHAVAEADFIRAMQKPGEPPPG